MFGNFRGYPTAAQLPFPLPSQDIQQCLSAFQRVSGCLEEVFKSFFSGQVGHFGPTCCIVITDISTSFWPKLFPFITPSFPPFLTTSCTKAKGAAPSIATAQISFPLLIRALSFPAVPSQDIQQCLSSFQSVNECLVAIFASSISGRVGQLGAACCKVIIEIKIS
ncbi:hypothetical protein IFM89_021747 [Coptis chinensis]|uniref:Prolamin-like domain-containing protein n=1 Tax=Coptis chinensis TaxID=261450 RepID=A0A835H849_9MAGN|nr:hypothetical protein IFM89_021747 [Coptis chinensis]